jgi:hypothetical protein
VQVQPLTWYWVSIYYIGSGITYFNVANASGTTLWSGSWTSTGVNIGEVGVATEQSDNINVSVYYDDFEIETAPTQLLPPYGISAGGNPVFDDSQQGGSMIFMASRGSNQVVTPGAASASVTIDKVAKAVRLANSGTNICYVRIGDSASGAATTADIPILPGTTLVVRKGDGEDTVSHISASGTTLNIQTGEAY